MELYQLEAASNLEVVILGGTPALSCALIITDKKKNYVSEYITYNYCMLATTVLVY